MKRSLPEIQFSGTQYQPQNFVEGKLNKVFPKKNWYLYKALFEDFEKSSSIAKKKKKSPSQHTFKPFGGSTRSTTNLHFIDGNNTLKIECGDTEI